MAAVELVSELDMDPNDCLAVEVMRRMGITEIFSFDKDFGRVSRIREISSSKGLDVSW